MVTKKIRIQLQLKIFSEISKILFETLMELDSNEKQLEIGRECCVLFWEYSESTSL